MSAKVLPISKDQPDDRVWIRVSDNLVLHRPSGVFYVRKSRAGKGRLFQSTGYTQKGKAQSQADQMIAEWLHGKRATTRRAQRVDEAIDQLEIDLEEQFLNKDRKPKTAAKDRVYLKQVKEHFGHYYLDEIDEEFLKSWLQTTGRKLNRTLFDLFKYLSKVLTYAYQHKWISRKPQVKNPDKKKRKGEPHIYTQAELQKIAEKCDLELLTQLALGSDCGNRTGEVRALEISMIKFMTYEGKAVAVITFPEDKAGAHRGEGREFMTSPRVAKLLKRWLKERKIKSQRYVFPSQDDPFKPQTAVYQNRKWRKACNAAGIIGRAWFYDLRHTFYTTALLEAREPVQHVSEFGGTSISTLQKRYLHSDAKKTASVSKAVRFKFGEEE